MYVQWNYFLNNLQISYSFETRLSMKFYIFTLCAEDMTIYTLCLLLMTNLYYL